MKKALIIGSTVIDVTITLPRLPSRGEDSNITGQTMSLGGCAYNVSEMLRLFNVPYILFSPVGTGTYGDMVREGLASKNIPLIIPGAERENGCCYCLVDAEGERTFICNRGAEYHFKKEWFQYLDASSIDRVYVCGLELEEPDAGCILDYLEEHPEFTIYFAPGPHITSIPSSHLERMIALSPILHLSETELLEFCMKLFHTSASQGAIEMQGGNSMHSGATFIRAVKYLSEWTDNTVIVTLGKSGAFLCNKTGACRYIQAPKAQQIDTTGAGDSHIGTVIAYQMKGYTLEDAILTANLVAASVVESEGAGLTEADFEKLF